MSETKKLIAEYRERIDEMSHYEKASLEERIWKSLTSNQLEKARVERGNRHHVRSSYLADLLDCDIAISVIEKRQAIHRGGAAAIPIWELVDAEDDPLPLYTGVTLMRDARKSCSRDETLSDRVPKVIKKYLKGSKAKSKGGTVVYRKYDRPATQEPTPANIKKLLLLYAEKRVEGGSMGHALAKKLKDELMFDFNEVLLHFTNKAARLKKQSTSDDEKAKSVSRRRLRESFEVLRLPPPKKGRPIDMAAVKKQKRALVRMYHPDAHGGDETMREQYQYVLEAVEIIETVYEQQGGVA